MKKHHYVYHSYEEWGRGYIGLRTCDCLPEKDIKYFGSFKDKTFNPTGKTILFVCETRKEAAEIEIKLHDFFDVAVNPKFANRSKAVSTGFDVTGVIFGPRTEETKKKISVANSGKTHTEEAKKKMSGEKTGKTHTEETKKKISVANTGVIRSTKTRAKMSEVQKGKTHGPEARAKISAARIGTKLSAETKAKMSTARKGKCVGENHPHSKVTDVQRLEIFERYTSGEKQKDLAAEFGLCRNQILKICKKVRDKLHE